MGKSIKTRIVEAIFLDRWDSSTKRISNPIVTSADLVQYIRRLNEEVPRGSKKLSDKNPANFFKDLVRKRESFNQNWPAVVFARGFTAVQVVGRGRIFKFVPVSRGQSEPFPYASAPEPPGGPPHLIESVSLSMACRRLGRTDESWLTQVSAKLRIVETHFALNSGLPVIQVDHLQMNVKLRMAEIDSLYLGALRRGRTIEEFVITCEAKGRSDAILTGQISEQVRAAFSQPNLTQEIVVPIAIKVVGNSAIQLVQFRGVRRRDASALTAGKLKVQKNMLYALRPEVEGLR